MDKTYNPKLVENKIYKFWQKTGFFNPDKLPGKRPKPYALLLPPPNITGELHMGHALNAAVQDALIRQKRMQGYKTLWLPGTDHAGIAAQNVVEKKLKKEGRTRFDLGRRKFLKEIWAWREEYGEKILEQLKTLGASCDWSRTAFTMDKNYAEAVKTVFVHYYKKGLIYQGERPINWCRRCQTSLSDLELEYKKQKGKLYYIKYKVKSQKSKVKITSQNSKLKDDDFIVVATTRPETMLGDTAVAVNPNDKRYKKLVNKTAILPIVDREIPIIADRLVDPKFGTGAVKITPAHNIKDYEIGLRHKLKIISVIDERGRINQAGPKEFQGLKTTEARERILEKLRNLELLKKEEDYENSVPLCYRCNTLIEIIPSKQWFLKMEGLAKQAIQAVKREKIKFLPKNFEKIYFRWLSNIRDWCISRQIWWGHQLPVWRCQTEKNYFVSLEKPKKCPICGKCRPKRVDDVLDTWFSSALWPFATLGWPSACAHSRKYCLPKRGSDLDKFYPSAVMVTARDIINLWVSRMIFSGLEFMGEIPFPRIFIHPTVLTKSGQRMSKSLGTGINPLKLVEKYGADSLRFGIAWQITGTQDIRFDEQNIVAGKKFCNKLWNAARFVIQQTAQSKIKNTLTGCPAGQQKSKIQIKSQKLTSTDKKILSLLNKTIKSVNQDLDNFRFGQAIQTLYHFFWRRFCDVYLEESKKHLNKEVLVFVLLESLKLLHPFMPFITEELYQALPLAEKKKSLMVEDWPNARFPR